MLICYAAIEGLLKLGILQGDKDDMLKTRTSVAFFPHGLGHYLGMDTVKFILVPSPVFRPMNVDGLGDSATLERLIF
jgi:hypothetical protein